MLAIAALSLGFNVLQTPLARSQRARSVVACAEPAAVTWLSTDSGVRYVDTVVGDGEEAKEESRVEVHYTGKLESTMAEFDSSYGRGVPITFTLGERTVIPGWEDGLVGMKVGGKRTLSIPSKLAYGPSGKGDRIPPNSDLYFETELVKCENGLDLSWTKKLFQGQNKFLLPVLLISLVPYLLPEGSLPEAVANFYGK